MWILIPSQRRRTSADTLHGRVANLCVNYYKRSAIVAVRRSTRFFILEQKKNKMSYSAIVLMTVVLASAYAAPQTSPTATKPPNISPEDLTYIIKVRNGEATTPPVNLSPCARAILGCCKANVMNTQCSENLKCGAFFFDVNPCEDKFIVEALQAARMFYQQFNKVMT
ncbi:hypothetical protein K1T71_005482 [Dendrolimus kikuchii]|uniref:Uncharacterized protein n=1 Tax=Dendrolimus kikuchii TaxID=765133 RepID=A0ACC1D594_9NEOP|nr:hypothetical protein K1T71_005482 [Dendrolimus kikuchii]